MTDGTQDNTQVIEFHIKDLDTKIKEYLDIHKNQEFLIKLYFDK